MLVNFARAHSHFRPHNSLKNKHPLPPPQQQTYNHTGMHKRGDAVFRGDGRGAGKSETKGGGGCRFPFQFWFWASGHSGFDWWQRAKGGLGFKGLGSGGWAGETW